jgi:DNA-binding response OmpR family regulator
MQPRNILCIDDKETCHLYDLLFANIDKKLRVTSAKNMPEAIDLVKSGKFDLFVLERTHSEIDGVKLCRIIRQTDKKTPIVFFSGMSREKDRSMAFAAGADAYFVKASDLDQFINVVTGLLD